jgi:hypothetical protein
VRAFSIEFADESFEPRLLLESVQARRPSRLCLEGAVHALMAAVLLWMAGLDALEGDAEPEPPHRQLREIVEAIRAGEWARRCRFGWRPEGRVP